MKKFRIVITLVALCFLLCACPNGEKGHENITFINKSDREIACQTYCSSDNITIDTDTLYKCRIGPDGIGPDSLYLYSSLSDFGWEVDFKDMTFIQFLIMDGETYRKYLGTPCDTIRKYVPVLHRYRLTLEDLQRMKWTVVYPPEK